MFRGGLLRGRTGLERLGHRAHPDPARHHHCGQRTLKEESTLNLLPDDRAKNTYIVMITP